MTTSISFDEVAHPMGWEPGTSVIVTETPGVQWDALYLGMVEDRGMDVAVVIVARAGVKVQDAEPEVVHSSWDVREGSLWVSASSEDEAADFVNGLPGMGTGL